MPAKDKRANTWPAPGSKASSATKAECEKPLTAREKKIAIMYRGSVKEIALVFNWTQTYVEKVLRKPNVQHYMASEEYKKVRKDLDKELQSAIASKEDRQKFWTNIMNDKKEDTKDRIKASELLAKVAGDFAPVKIANPDGSALDLAPKVLVLSGAMQGKLDHIYGRKRTLKVVNGPKPGTKRLPASDESDGKDSAPQDQLSESRTGT